MVIRKIFVAAVAILAVQRLLELRLSKRNEKRILEKGGLEFFPAQIRVMKILHMGWFGSMLLEVFKLKRPFLPILSTIAAVLLVLGQFLRYSAIRTLRERWTVNLMCIPGTAPVQSGIYRYIRHPNYLGVALEVAAVPLLHSAYLTAAVFSILNAFVLNWRIRSEEMVLNTFNQYDTIFANQTRFLPRLRFDREDPLERVPYGEIKTG